MQIKSLTSVILVVVSLVGSARPSRADSVDRMLAEVAPKIANRLAQEGFETVAVMPFRLRNPESGVSMKGAMIQTSFACKLERALAASYDRKHPVQVVFDAWDQVQQKNAKASILTTAARKAIFEQEFALPVASPNTKIDAFATGIIEPSDDYRSTKITFELCYRDQPERLMRLKPATVINTDRHTLVSMGRGFAAPVRRSATRSLSEDDIMNCVAEDIEFARIKDAKHQVKRVEDRVSIPATDALANSHVELRIYYDNKLQDMWLDTTGGQHNLTIKDPQEDQIVTFEIENHSNEAMGVVLAINGINTLYGGDATEPSSSATWIVQPNRTYGVQGIYGRERKSVTPIRGLSDESSEAILREGRMHLDLAGLIGFFVFREVSKEDDSQNESNTLAVNQINPSDVPNDAGTPSEDVNPSVVTNTTKSDPKDSESNSGGKDIVIQSDDNELTGFNLGLVRSLSFHPRDSASRAGSWTKLKNKLLEPTKRSSASRGLMVADGPRQEADVKIASFGDSEMISGAIIRYFSVAIP